jgi:hypothetical protein
MTIAGSIPGHLRGVAAPCIVPAQFTLLEMAAELGDGHHDRIRSQVGPVNFSDQAENCIASFLRSWKFGDCSNHSLAVNARALRTFLRPSELPNIGPSQAAFDCEAAVLHENPPCLHVQGWEDVL